METLWEPILRPASFEQIEGLCGCRLWLQAKNARSIQIGPRYFTGIVKKKKKMKILLEYGERVISLRSNIRFTTNMPFTIYFFYF